MKNILEKMSYMANYICILLLSCNTQVADHKKNENIKLQSNEVNLSDSTKVIKEFYSNGNLKSERNTYNGNTHGVVKTYFETGELEMESVYKNNLPDGKTIYFFKSGVIRSNTNYNKGIRNGVVLNYFETGKIKAYAFFDHLGRVMYRKDYDEKGNIIKEAGNGFTDVMVNNDTFAINEEIIALIHVATPPDVLPTLYVNQLDKQGNFINKTEVAITDNKYEYRYKYNKPGKYKWGALLELKSKNNGKTKIYDFSMDIFVK